MRFGFTTSSDRRVSFSPFPKAGLSNCLMPAYYFVYNDQHLKLCLQPNADFQPLVCLVCCFLPIDRKADDFCQSPTVTGGGEAMEHE